MACEGSETTALAQRRDPGVADGHGLLLAPSRGFGGGIERVATAIEEALPGIARVDLYDARHHTASDGNRVAKIQFAARSLRAALRLRPAYVLCLHAGLLPAAAAAAAAARIPLFLFAIGTEVWARMSAATRRLVASCRRTIAISEYTAGWTAVRAGIPRSQVLVLHLPIARSLAEAGAAQPDSCGRARPLLTVSRLVREHRYKGHFEIAAAMPQVLEACPDAHWEVVGSGDDVAALKQRCAQLGVAGHVTLSGAVGEDVLAQHYGSAAALVLPSVADATSIPPIGEGFGLVYAEAGAFGVPSIASTAGGGALDFVVHGRTGLLVDPGATRQLADAMVAMLDDDLRAPLGAAARALVRERHLPEHFAAGLRRALS